VNRIASITLAALLAGCTGTTGPSGTPGGGPVVASPPPTSQPPSPTSAAPATPGSSGVATSALPAFADDEPLLLFSLRTDLGGGIFVMAPDGSGRRQLATDVRPGTYKAPEWSPDGKDVVFVEEEVGELFIAHLDGSPTEIVETCRGGYCDNPAWSSDGRRLAFTRFEPVTDRAPTATQIDVLDLSTGTISTVLRLVRPLLADAPRWSADGSQLVIQVDRMDDDSSETGAAIAIVPAGGGDARYLTEFEAFAGSPDWGWVSNEIVYAVDLQELQRIPPGEDVSFDLFAIRPGGTGARQITNLVPGGRLHSPRWTPDGEALIAKQFDHGAGGSRLVDPETGSVTAWITGLDETRPLIRPLAP
jgi:Tol biopolymer transport system component